MAKQKFKKGDFVTCIGEAQTIFRIAEVHEDGFCSLMTLKPDSPLNEEYYHGAESPHKLTKIKKIVKVCSRTTYFWSTDWY